jgi:hypothetical protein
MAHTTACLRFTLAATHAHAHAHAHVCLIYVG